MALSTAPAIKPVPGLPTFRWNEAAGRYISPSGRFVSVERIRGELDRFITGTTNLMEATSRRLVAGEISLAEWQGSMMVLTKEVNLAGAALESGGWYSMGPSEFGRAGQKIRGEYGFLNNFANEIADGTQRLDGTLVNRAKLYGEQGRVTYYDFARVTAEALGFTEERSRLQPAEHCELCVSEQARGWQPLGSIIKIGSRTCLSNCRCFMEYRKLDGTKATIRTV